MQDDDTPTSPASSDASGAPNKRGLDRRAFLRSSTAAAPVVLTLAGGPVAAHATGTVACTVASSFVSVATFQSRSGGAVARCTMNTVEHWRATCGNANHPAVLNNLVRVYLNVSTSSPYNGSTLKAVLLDGSAVATSGELGFLQHLLALSLNLDNGMVGNPGGVNRTYLNGVWSNYWSNGRRYVLPASNINWGDAELITWLRVLMYPMPA